MSRIKIHFLVLILAICAWAALAYAATGAVWSTGEATAEPTIQAVISSTIPGPDTKVTWTHFGYCVTDPSLGVVTIRSCMSEHLGTPVPAIPDDGLHYSHYPRSTILVWSPVTDATGYRLDIEMVDDKGHNEAQTYLVKDAWFKFIVNGPLTCRWRVTALDNTQTYASSEPSEWQSLDYLL